MTISAHKLKKLRQHNGWSQDRLADISGLSLRTVQRIESGESASLESQLALASAFDVSPADLRDEQECAVGHGGLNYSGIAGIALCVIAISLQMKLAAVDFIDSYSVFFVFGLTYAMAAISMGSKDTLASFKVLKFVLVLPNQSMHLQKHAANLKQLAFYAHVSGAISSLLGFIAVLMNPQAVENALLIGTGVSLLTLLYGAMFAEFLIRPLKHKLERMLIQ